jgi:RNA polymerase-binding transcription factor DksA
MVGKADRVGGANSAGNRASNRAKSSAGKGSSVETQPLDAGRFQKRLLEMKSQLEQDLETHQNGAMQLNGGPDEPGPGQHWEHSGYGDHQADDATELFEREKEVGLGQSLRAHLQQVTHALARIEEGTYGQCERCGKPIARARLEALPEATLCIDCKAAMEQQAAHGQPAEEYVSPSASDVM